VSALGLDFGAVDVALRKDGVPVVWEVNKAPGLEGGSLKKYAEKLIQLAT
jgi:glutathione synthase/RimK-type ligase-like ATP-grasp enzyme